MMVGLTSGDRRCMGMLAMSAIMTVLVASLAIVEGMEALLVLALPIMPLCILHIRSAGARDEESIRRAVFEESPIAMGHMVISMQRNPSFEEALMHVGERGRGTFPSMVRRMIWESLIDPRRGLTERVPMLLRRISEGNEGLVNGLQLLMAASKEGSKEGRSRLLDKAYDMVLRGFKERMESYASSLPSSLAMLFSLGILLPMVMLTMMPMTGMVSVSTIGASSYTNLLAPLFILVIPAVDVVMAMGIVQRNPMHRGGLSGCDPVDLALLLSAPTIMVVSLLVSLVPLTMALPLTIVPCACLWLRGRQGHIDRRRETSERGRDISTLYTMGNRLMSGTSMEAAIVEDDPPSMAIGGALTRARMLGTPLEESLGTDVGGGLIPDAIHAVSVSANSDSIHAGQMAINLAKYASDLESVRRGMGDRIRETMDSMRNTSLIFAPIILGISASMVGPLLGTGTIAAVMAVYLMELCIIISYLSEYVSGDGSPSEMLHSASLSIPVATMVFLIASEVGRIVIGPLPI